MVWSTTLRAMAGGSLLVAAAGIGLATAQDHEVLRGRLIYADHEKPVVNVLDLDTGAVTHRLEVPKANPTLLPTEGGRFVVLRVGDDAGTVKFLDSGLLIESHDDHADIEKDEVRMLDLTLVGDKPSHVVSENGWTGIFYDGQRPWLAKSDPKLVAVKNDTLDRAEPEVAIWQSPAPQHGIAVPLGGDDWLISMPNPIYAKGEDKTASSRPDGFRILDKAQDWKVVADFNDPADRQRSCKAFHGHASSRNVHVFGCNADLGDAAASDGGVLVIGKGADGKWDSRKLDYPDANRTSTIKAAHGARYMIANYGGQDGRPFDALLRIDPAAEKLSAADVFKLPEAKEVCQFEPTHGGKGAANLTADGKLRIYDVEPNWGEAATFDAVAAFDCAWDATTPQPTLAIIGDSAFVSDPEKGRIRAYNLNTMKHSGDFAVGGKPARIASGGNAG